jgi:hypothetical protein
MAIQLSPSVVVKERDLTNVVPAVSTSVGATIVDAAWGPVMDVTTVDSENELARRFGRPNSANAASWLTAANFLAYSNNMLVVRTDTNAQRNAVATLTNTVSSITVSDGGTGYTGTVTVTVADPGVAGGERATAEAVIAGGVIVSINVTYPGSGYTIAPVVSITGTNSTPASATANLSSTGVKINNNDSYLGVYANKTASVIGEFAAKYPGTLGNSLTVSMADYNSFATWDYRGNFDSAPGTSEYASNNGALNDELHVVVVDAFGKFTGSPGQVLETFAFVSKASDAKKSDGTAAYYKDVINNQSQYVWWTGHPVAGNDWGDEALAGVDFAALTGNGITRSLEGGVDAFVSTEGQKIRAFELFSNDEEFDVNLIMVGKATPTVANYVVQNIAEIRKDCVAFISPQDVSSGDPLIGNTSDITEKLIAYRNQLTSSSYMVIDSGFKYQYDRYNDQYRWVPLNGDVAGLCARTDFTDDPWFSPAGLNRGQIKNVVKLAFSPRKTDRDNLYKSGINPVVSFPGQGVVLYGDKTGLAKPSAFDRINVRRLFITLEKAIATAAKYQLFEFNDSFTRAQFRNIVEPFLRDVKGRRGVTDFKVVCDESNNTAEVIDTNRFVADIYIKPARSINFIQLNFIATRTGANFNEIAG